MSVVTLAVAGSRKTQSIVNACSDNPEGLRRLVLTYTLTGQAELETRLRTACQPGEVPEVMGWYAFLLRHWVRPFLALLFPDRHLRGLNFEGEPAAGRYAAGVDRHLDGDDRAYMIHLSRLALDVATASENAVIDRLQRCYDEIYVDEVQDLTGCDLHVLTEIMKSTIDLHMVGDLRQSVFETNYRDQNLKQYKGLKMLDWFQLQEKSGLLTIEHSATTWRSNQIIATFSDSIFPAHLGFTSTTSAQEEDVSHKGVFALHPDDVVAYVREYHPLCLRDSIRTAREVDLPFRNFGKVKGITADHVLIYPVGTVRTFLATGKELADGTACGLYVAVTRAKHSVAFVLEDPTKSSLPCWKP